MVLKKLTYAEEMCAREMAMMEMQELGSSIESWLLKALDNDQDIHDEINQFINCCKWDEGYLARVLDSRCFTDSHFSKFFEHLDSQQAQDVLALSCKQYGKKIWVLNSSERQRLEVLIDLCFEKLSGEHKGEFIMNYEFILLFMNANYNRPFADSYQGLYKYVSDLSRQCTIPLTFAATLSLISQPENAKTKHSILIWSLMVLELYGNYKKQDEARDDICVFSELISTYMAVAMLNTNEHEIKKTLLKQVEGMLMDIAPLAINRLANLNGKEWQMEFHVQSKQFLNMILKMSAVNIHESIKRSITTEALAHLVNRSIAENKKLDVAFLENNPSIHVDWGALLEKVGVDGQMLIVSKFPEARKFTKAMDSTVRKMTLEYDITLG